MADDQVTEEVTEVEDTDFDTAKAIWDKAQDDRPRDERGRYAVKDEAAPEAPEKEPEAPPEKPEEVVETAPQSEAPGHLPRAIKDVWKDIPEAVRPILSENQQEYARRLSEAEQMRRAVGPVYDRVVQAAREMPALQNMTPDQVAGQVFELAQWANRLESDPVEAIMAIAAHRGVTDDLRSRFGGEGGERDPVADLKAEIAALKQQMGSHRDPDIESQIAQQMEIARLDAEVQAFSQSKPDWGVLRPHIEARIPELRDANPQLQPMEVLQLAYDTVAKEYLNPLRSAAAEDAVKARKAEAAREATAINVQPEGAGEPSPLTEREAAKAVWDRLHT